MRGALGVGDMVQSWTCQCANEKKMDKVDACSPFNGRFTGTGVESVGF